MASKNDCKSLETEFYPIDGNLRDPESLEQMDFTVVSIRQGFVRKVYCILMIQLAITTGFIAVFTFEPTMRLWIRRNSGILIWALILSFVLIVAMSCCERARRRFPLNMIFLLTFTIVEGFLVGVVTSIYEAESVLLAAGITIIVCFALTIFAFQTKIDFTGWGPYLFVAAIVLFLFGLAAVCLRRYFPMLHMVYACLGVLLYGFYLVYDTQMIIGGNHKNSISPEEYTFAALTLYMDIISLFMKILTLTGKKRS